MVICDSMVNPYSGSISHYRERGFKYRGYQPDNDNDNGDYCDNTTEEQQIL